MHDLAFTFWTRMRSILPLTALLLTACGSFLLLFGERRYSLFLGPALLCLPAYQVIRLPKDRTLHRLAQFGLPVTVLLVTSALYLIADQRNSGYFGALMVWIGVVGGAIVALWLVSLVQDAFAGLYLPALYLDYAQESGQEGGAEAHSTLLAGLHAIMSCYAFWSICFAWLLLLVRLLRGGQQVHECRQLWLMAGIALLLTVSVRVYTFVVSTREARGLVIHFVVGFIITALVAAPEIVSAPTALENVWLPLARPSATSDAASPWWLYAAAGLLGVFAGETLLYAMLGFVDVRRSYFEFLAEGSGKAETIADSRTEFMRAATDIVRMVESYGSGTIRIATQTAGQQWGDLQRALEQILSTSGPPYRFVLELLCPPHPSNFGRIAEWAAHRNVTILCCESMAVADLKFLIGHAPGLSIVLLGRPSQEPISTERFFPKARWGYVFRDPIVVGTYDSLFRGIAQRGNAGRTLPEIMLESLLAYCKADYMPEHVIGDGQWQAIWSRPGPHPASMVLDISEGKAFVELSEQGVASTMSSVPGVYVRHKSKTEKLLFLDFDGVCADTTHYVELASLLGQRDAAEILVEGYRSENDTDLEMRLRQLVRLCSGLSFEAFNALARSHRMRGDAINLIKRAKHYGVKVFVSTNGSATFVRTCLEANGLNVDGVWGAEMGFERGICNGEIMGRLVHGASKGHVVCGMCQLYGCKAFAVGNGWNDIEMFRAAAECGGWAFLLRGDDEAARELERRSSRVKRIESLDAVLTVKSH